MRQLNLMIDTGSNGEGMHTGVFDLFKIGIGPSSSHTVGPMRAAYRFLSQLSENRLLSKVNRLRVELYGSLALTGKGHGTDRGILLGLTGHQPETVEPGLIDEQVQIIATQGKLLLFGLHSVPLTSDTIVFHKDQVLPGHSNGMRFTALDAIGHVVDTRLYYSVGGGSVREEGQGSCTEGSVSVPHPFHSAEELLGIGKEHQLAIWEIVLENEKARHSEAEIHAYVERIWDAMHACVLRGLETEGILPGGLNVPRRAPQLASRLEIEGDKDPLSGMDWVNAFAMAVSEENAAGGRVVTAPTNGAAGVVPAVAHYYDTFIEGASKEGLFRFFLTAAAIGILYKENASMSGAELGCQGEVGVACSMAAGGFTAALGGTNQQVEYAAEIGMEHNLGMTCDPIGGLVQSPCIERNAMGAVKAINACRIAMRESGEHKVSLDQVIQTMYQTGLDMQSRYKETSLGHLALNIIEC
jgi:L-serine dehydratase